jgi:predicted ABC-type ATPase
LGYHISLFFLRLSDPEIAIARVASRVRQGGHDIPEAVIRRRFTAGLRNLERLYKPEADDWIVYDNSGDRPVPVEWSERQ